MLFPDFIRGHFKKEAISGFITDNVQHFRVAGEEQLCSVELFSGFQFQSTLTVPATFFTAKTAEILQHWHLNTGVNQIDLQSRGSAPIGINPENNTQREELKKRAREYIHNLTFEPLYADQVTDAIRSTMLPRKVLKIVQRFGQRSNVSEMRALFLLLSDLTNPYIVTHGQTSIVHIRNALRSDPPAVPDPRHDQPAAAHEPGAAEHELRDDAGAEPAGEVDAGRAAPQGDAGALRQLLAVAEAQVAQGVGAVRGGVPGAVPVHGGGRDGGRHVRHLAERDQHPQPVQARVQARVRPLALQGDRQPALQAVRLPVPPDLPDPLQGRRHQGLQPPRRRDPDPAGRARQRCYRDGRRAEGVARGRQL